MNTSWHSKYKIGRDGQNSRKNLLDEIEEIINGLQFVSRNFSALHDFKVYLYCLIYNAHESVLFVMNSKPCGDCGFVI